MAIIDQFEVTILVEGKPATEYKDVESSNGSNDTRVITKYIEVTSGSCFAFKYGVLPSYNPEGEDGVLFSFDIDGKPLTGRVCRKEQVRPVTGFTCLKDSTSVSSEKGWGRSSFSFADLETREIDLPVGSTS